MARPSEKILWLDRQWRRLTFFVGAALIIAFFAVAYGSVAAVVSRIILGF